MGLGDAMADVVYGIEPRHLLLLQEEDRMAFALGEDGDQDIGARHFLAAGGLHMDGRALEHPLEAGGGLGLAPAVGDEIAELAVDVVDQVAAQALDIDVAGPHHRDRVGILG